MAPVGDHLVQRLPGDEAEVEGTRHRQVRLGLEFVPPLVQIDLLVAIAQRLALRAKRLQAHTQHPGVEILAGSEVRGGQDQMIQMVDQQGGLRVGTGVSLGQARTWCAITCRGP